ncbi:protein FAR1-RELATED SEQUENCE 6-like [Dioscorea cayenensis subsp. rotundata]|uniref:Protein FAR1-RELATED SEQUENCE n=1 Tax=Dioscorea cayennensis subsp. rotundata TaxID=55577 RepID=A0AB40C0M3_DIOCR|nr:protein FAR1-RELATED SEQUENCE 6-like [Dioscorea cayenensis subsp. rotundata]
MAIQGAVRLVFPNSHHRLCMWHIMKKVLEKLGGLNEYKAIKNILKHIMYEAVDTQEFEDTYLKMMADYKIENNEWLNSLFKIRDRWAHVYVKGIFWVGMSTIQRSESVNAFFDSYVGPTTSLKQFVEQYDNALKSKIEKENKADFASFNSFCSFKVSDVVKGKEGAFRKQVVYNVYTNEEEFDIKYSCQLFQFKGIICRHICKVLIEKNVKDIPSRYILPRWRKDIKCMHTYVQNCYDDPQTNEEKLRYNKLCSHFTKAAELGAESSDKYMFLMKYVDEAIEKLMDNTTCKEKFTPMLSEEINVTHQKFLTPLKVQSEFKFYIDQSRHASQFFFRFHKAMQGSLIKGIVLWCKLLIWRMG